ncbi:MAG: DUF1294 domain-containing protein [Planctomycetota bacterium]
MLAPIVGILTVLNGLSLAGFAIDKRLSKRGSNRISEKRLHQLAFLGPAGALFGVWWVRHKTRKASFLLPFALVLMLSLACHLGILYGIWWYRSDA